MPETSSKSKLEFYFDYVSPYTYLADTQLGSLDVDIDYQPVNILAVMAMVNNQPSPKCPPKGRYGSIDAGRWAKRYGVKLQSNAALWAALQNRSFDSALLVRGALAAQAQGNFEQYHHAIFNAVWRDNGDVATPAGRNKLLADAGLDPDLIWREAETPEIATLLEERNKAAAEKGVFGTPTFFLDGEQFFGNDRFDFIRERLAARS